MPTLKLTKGEIDRIKAPDSSGKQVLHWDSELKGFGVLASGKTTAKTYIAQRRMPSGLLRRLTVGSVAEIDLKRAREMAADMLNDLRHGKDPKADRRRRGKGTLRATLEDYLVSNKGLGGSTKRTYRTAIESYLPGWLDLPLTSITTEMVADRHAAIAAEIATRQRGNRRGGAVNTGQVTANNVMRMLRILWLYAAGDDPQMQVCPVRALNRRKSWYPEARREGHVRGDDLPKFYAAVQALPNPILRDFILLLMFSGMRKSEAASLRWTDVDFSGEVIRIPAVRTKSGRPLALPMTSVVRRMLVARRGLGNADFVFPGNGKAGHLADPSVAFKQIALQTGISVSPHDLRRTYLTAAESCDISGLALKALVNHALPSDVTSGYVQMSDQRLREVAQRISDRIEGLCCIDHDAPANVAKLLSRV